MMFFVISAAEPVTAVTGRVPSGLALTGLTGLSHPHLGVADVPTLVSVDHVAKARHLTNAAALLCLYRTRNEPTGRRACVTAYNLVECASHHRFGPIAPMRRQPFCGFPNVAAPCGEGWWPCPLS